MGLTAIQKCFSGAQQSNRPFRTFTQLGEWTFLRAAPGSRRSPEPLVGWAGPEGAACARAVSVEQIMGSAAAQEKPTVATDYSSVLKDVVKMQFHSTYTYLK